MKVLAKLLLLICLLLAPISALAQETWTKGDSIATFFLCSSEKDIMDVALADSKNMDAYAQQLLAKTISQNCFRLAPPQMFVVEEVISTYKDYKDVATCVLKIKKIGGDFMGYVVAAGVPKENKGI
tara:strand:- start:353 stop:730 length:378 start_codon:yes stop_codon:yes gene_type:complete